MFINIKLILLSLMMLLNFNIFDSNHNINKHKSYLNEAHDVLEHYPKRTIEAWMMADAYIYCLKEYHITVPLDIALAQGLLESGFGATNKNNQFNIRGKGNNYHNMFDSPEEGVLAYYKLMCKSYLSCKTEKQLLNNFTNCGGYRYAENKTYEYSLRKTINNFEKYRND